MTSLLLGALAATSLAVASIGTPGETRSAQSLPNDHLVLPATNTASSGKYHDVTRLADGSSGGEWDHTNKSLCDFHHWHWYTKENRCHRRDVVPVYLIGAATLAGLGYALASRDGGGSGQSPISH